MLTHLIFYKSAASDHVLAEVCLPEKDCSLQKTYNFFNMRCISLPLCNQKSRPVIKMSIAMKILLCKPLTSEFTAGCTVLKNLIIWMGLILLSHAQTCAKAHFTFAFHPTTAATPTSATVFLQSPEAPHLVTHSDLSTICTESS